MREIFTSSDIIDEIERKRAELGMSKRKVSVSAAAGHGSYWAVTTFVAEPTLSKAIAYLRAVGLKLYVG